MKLFLIAGEASGDKLGAALMAGMKRLSPGVEFAGVGGPLMAAEGLDSLFPMDELSVMGIAEILPKYAHLKRRIREAADAVLNEDPAALITIDSPDFCLRVARQVKDAAPETPVIHYVAPSVWAWRPGRAKKMARVVDHVMALLPFEPPYMRAAGMTCDFVGHPVVAEPLASPAEIRDFRGRAGIDDDARIVLCLPGSRTGEVTRLGPRFGAALGLAAERVEGLRVVVPTVPGVADLTRATVAAWPVPALVVESAADRLAAFGAAEAALAASGTVSLELAANRTPMAIGYDASRLSWEIVSRLLRVDTVTLVNLVSETRAVPEFLGPRRCQPGPMAEALIGVLQDRDARRAQIAAMDLTMRRLGEGGEAPGLRAARSVLAAIDRLAPGARG